MTRPTRAEMLTAYHVMQFLVQPHMCLTSDAPHIVAVGRLLAEYILNEQEEEAT